LKIFTLCKTWRFKYFVTNP